MRDASASRLRARPDLGWLHGFYDRLESDPASRGALTAVANDLVDLRAGRLQVRHPDRLVPGLDDTDPIAWHYDLVDVKWSQTLERVAALCARAAPLAALVATVSAGLGIDADTAARVVERLIDAGVIVFARPTALMDPLAQLSGAFAAEHALAPALHAASDALRALEKLPPSALAPADIRAAAQQLNALHGASGSPLQLDRTEEFEGTLGDAVVADAVRLAGLMVASAQPRSLERYRTRFRERYEGEERLVPLLELVDPGLGIGVPENTALERLDRDPVRDELRLRLAATALRERSSEVVLDDAELAVLHPGDKDVPPRTGCEIGFQIAAAGPDALRAGDYALRPVFGLHTDGAIKTVSRFADALGADFRTRLHELEAADDDPDALAVELVYLPHDRHYANLLRPGVHRHVLASQREQLPDGVPRIEPRDVVIGLEQGRFVAYSRSLGRRLRVCETYMLSTAYFAPAHVRLLSLIGKQDRVHPRLFDWGAAAALPFLPRVRHGRLVLAVAQWSLMRSALGGAADPSATVAAWRAQWNVPRWVYLIERDLKLLLDLDSPVALELLRDHVAADGDRPSGPELRFEEMFPSFDELWLERGGEPCFHELTLGIPGRGPAEAPAAAPRRAPAAAPAAKGPGSEWTFVKLYAPRRELQGLLCGPVADLVAERAEHGGVDRWFYLHYGDPQPHLRLRLHHAGGTGERSVAALATRLEDLLARGVLVRYAFDTYRPELERYGGADAIEPAEILFHHDSRRVLDALRSPATGALGHAERAMATAAPLLRAWFEAFDQTAWLAAGERDARAVRDVDWKLVRRIRELLGRGAGRRARRARGDRGPRGPRPRRAARRAAGRPARQPPPPALQPRRDPVRGRAGPLRRDLARLARSGARERGRGAGAAERAHSDRRPGGAVRTPDPLWRSKVSESPPSWATGSRNPS